MEKLLLAFTSLFREFVIGLPDEFSKVRVWYYNRRGCRIARHVSLSPNVRIRGRVEIEKGSSIAQNSAVNGMSVGVFIGSNVMIAPNVVIVAFDHGSTDLETPMVLQPEVEEAIHIENDVWIGANTTVGKGVRIGRGSIIGANSYVNRDVPAWSIAGGVPARVVKSRAP